MSFKVVVHSSIPVELASAIDSVAEKQGISISKAVLLVLLQAYKTKAFEKAKELPPEQVTRELKQAFEDFESVVSS